jgi:hypothetical protein
LFFKSLSYRDATGSLELELTFHAPYR